MIRMKEAMNQKQRKTIKDQNKGMEYTHAFKFKNEAK